MLGNGERTKTASPVAPTKLRNAKTLSSPFDELGIDSELVVGGGENLGVEKPFWRRDLWVNAVMKGMRRESLVNGIRDVDGERAVTLLLWTVLLGYSRVYYWDLTYWSSYSLSVL